jgi:hypothetical protein
MVLEARQQAWAATTATREPVAVVEPVNVA